MNAVKLVRGFNEKANTEALRVLASLNYPLTQGKLRGIPITTRLIVPIFFDSGEQPKK
jgi:hypothetical protein